MTITTVITMITTTIETFMKLKLLFALLTTALLASMSGCVVHAPGVRVRPPIHIEGGGGGGGGGPIHCPPGQAKKGNC